MHLLEKRQSITAVVSGTASSTITSASLKSTVTSATNRPAQSSTNLGNLPSSATASSIQSPSVTVLPTDQSTQRSSGPSSTTVIVRPSISFSNQCANKSRP